MFLSVDDGGTGRLQSVSSRGRTNSVFMVMHRYCRPRGGWLVDKNARVGRLRMKPRPLPKFMNQMSPEQSRIVGPMALPTKNTINEGRTHLCEQEREKMAENR